MCLEKRRLGSCSAWGVWGTNGSLVKRFAWGGLGIEENYKN